MNKQRRFPSLSPLLPPPPLRAGSAPPPPAHKWPHTRRDGGRAPNYASLLTRGHGGEGTAAAWGTDRGCWLLPITETGGAEVTSNLLGRSPSARASAHLPAPAMVGGHRWSGPAGTSGKGWQEKPAGTPVASCSLWRGRAGAWWEND